MSEVAKKFKMKDGTFYFWIAVFDSSMNDLELIFRVREDNTPKNRALENRIVGYSRLRPATDDEINTWFKKFGDRYALPSNQIG